jgi:hypothetical protein
MPGPLGDDHRCSGDHVEGIDGPGRSLDWLDVEGSHAIRVATESPTEAFLDRKKDYAVAERMPRSSIGFRGCGHSGRTRIVSAPSGLSATTILMPLQIRSMVWFSPVKPRTLRSLKRTTRQRRWAAAVENSSDPYGVAPYFSRRACLNSLLLWGSFSKWLPWRTIH